MAESNESLDRVAGTNHYQRLGVQPVSTGQEIEAAYARLRAEWQARAIEGEPDAPRELRLLDEAYATLADPGQRAAYERWVRNAETNRALVVSGDPGSLAVPDGGAAPVLTRQCPNEDCGEPVPIQMMSCPRCGTQLCRLCPQCGQRVRLGEPVCPRCNTPIVEYDQRRFSEAAQVEERVIKDRAEAESNHKVLVALNEVLRRQAIVFWAAALVACIGLSAVAWLVAYVLGVFSGG